MKKDYRDKPKGIKRIFFAFVNTGKGFVWLSKNEAAFKQELVFCIGLVVLSFSIGLGVLEQVLLISTLLFVLFAEIVNTAIEVVVDRVGLERHPLSGLAKDLGSAAVFLSLVMAVIVWGAVLWTA
ncbi:diacylglycerol kinase [Endozoicomonas sp. G2_1]|uniref:diacylglycerol kinase n=1 Tax=Endozoicomonas sp. G2_1 TaxID=2821091 RepID=UPI001ADD191A|nr:diacylglycerol kinase [Endozoicomonas sp. G2_1]MBO9489690.1 diacylglycerol kinase [Endozoicomonas sp. G2_1]